MKKTISAAVFAVAMGFVSVNSFAGITFIDQVNGLSASTRGPAVAGGATGSTASVHNFTMDVNGSHHKPNVTLTKECVSATSGTVAGAASWKNGKASVEAGSAQTVINGN